MKTSYFCTVPDSSMDFHHGTGTDTALTVEQGMYKLHP